MSRPSDGQAQDLSTSVAMWLPTDAQGWPPDTSVPADVSPQAEALADEIDQRIRAQAEQTVPTIRSVRRAYSSTLRSAPGEHVLAVAHALLDRQRWVAYELLYHHPSALSVLDPDRVLRLGRGIDSWGSVDAFGRYITGPAWQRGLIPDALVRKWTASTDRWWRRAALVSTVPLNLPAAGGTGDTRRTLDICRRLVDDRDDMVVKALSWALRQLTVWDRDSVERFLEVHNVAARVRREVRRKLDTGRKN